MIPTSYRLVSVVLCMLLFVFGVSMFAGAWTPYDEYKLSVQANGEELAVATLSISDDAAVVKTGDVTEHFDLKNQRWQHESKQWVTLKQCELWARQSREKARSSSVVVPDEIRTFIEWTMRPKFEISSTDDTLTLTSGQIDYKIEVEKTERDLTNYFRYARLNAYKKAMTERKFAPFPELLVLEELEQRKLLPKSMEVKMLGIPGAPAFKIVISNEVGAE